MLINPSLQIAVMSRNRPKYLADCILSIFNAIALVPNNISSSILLSDNSDSDSCINLVKKINNSIKICARRPNVDFNEHIQLIFDECDSTYLVIFHDDDLMLPSFLVELLYLIQSNENIAAVGSNANYINGDIISTNTFFQSKEETILLDKQELFLNKYFLIGEQGIAPLPSYMYRLSVITNIRPSVDKGGLHADCSFLFDIIKKGPIIWSSKILMSYRLHESNVTKETTIYNKLALKRYLSSHYKLNKPQALSDYRYTIMMNFYRSCNLSLFKYYSWTKRQKIIAKFLLFELFNHFVFRSECRSLHFRVFYKKFFD
jgi:hypothetical protein